MKIKPLFDRVVIEPIENESETKSGILLPMAAQENSQLGRVMAIGDGQDLEGNDLGMKVCVGDKVLYGKFAGTEIKLDEKKYYVIRQTDILAIIEEA